MLVVVDNSGSMADEQATLADGYAPFVESLQSTLGFLPDLHVMVVDVDAWQYEGCDDYCDPPPECEGSDGTCDSTLGGNCFATCAVGLACENDTLFSCDLEPSTCDQALGAGITSPFGPGSSNADCQFATGARYFASEQEVDAAATFACATTVGTGSTAATERPMEAMVAAVADGSDASACNDGFLRDDALLVVVFATDESDDVDDSVGTPNGWRQSLITAKGGVEDRIVVLGLFGDGDQPNPTCPPFNPDTSQGAENAPRLRAFIDLWDDHALSGSICAGSYAPFFMDAGELVGEVCTGL